MNPFADPGHTFDVNLYLNEGPEADVIEQQFHEFFKQQVSEDLLDGAGASQLKIYLVHREYQSKDIEVVQACLDSQAANLFLLYETKFPDSYPFTERLALYT